MSNLEQSNSGKKAGDTPAAQSWPQRHGAALMIAVFGVLTVLMVVMQRKSVH